MTPDCCARSTTDHTVKYADDATVVDDNREEVNHLVDWCKTNNLALNVEKPKEIIVDFRRNWHSHTPLVTSNTAVEEVSSTKFLGVQITDTLSWSCKEGSAVPTFCTG